MFENTRDAKHRTRDRIVLTVVVVLAVVLFITLVFKIGLPNGPQRITDFLMEEGVDTTGITFVEDTSVEHEWWDSSKVLVSSEPFEYNGQVAQRWQYTYQAMGLSGILSTTNVEPYPPVPKPVALRLEIPNAEYEALVALAGDEPVEEYLLRLIQDEAGSI